MNASSEDAGFCPHCGAALERGPDPVDPYCKKCCRYILPLEYSRAVSGESGPCESSFVGIRGWLILPAIGVVVNPILLIATIITDLAARTEYSWVLREYPALKTLLGVEIAGDVVLLGLFSVLAILFFSKRRSARPMFMWTNGASVGLSIILILLSVPLWERMPGLVAEMLPRGIGGGIACVVWISYFRCSRRVAATFVR
jgi:hypothetical protein